MERWGGGMFCWNEKCKTSPVYWKLPGARGVPPAKTVPIAPVTAPTTSSNSTSSSNSNTDSNTDSNSILSPSTTATTFSASKSNSNSNNSKHNQIILNAVGSSDSSKSSGNGTSTADKVILKRQPAVYGNCNTSTNTGSDTNSTNSGNSGSSSHYAVSLLDGYSDWHGVGVGGDQATKQWGLHQHDHDQLDGQIGRTGHAGRDGVLNKENRRDVHGDGDGDDKSSGKGKGVGSGSTPLPTPPDTSNTNSNPNYNPNPNPNDNSNPFITQYNVYKTPQINKIVNEDFYNRPYTRIIEGDGRVDYYNSIVHDDPPRIRTDTHDSTTSEESQENPGEAVGTVSGQSCPDYLSNDKINHLIFASTSVDGDSNTTSGGGGSNSSTVDINNNGSIHHLQPQFGSFQRSLIYDK